LAYAATSPPIGESGVFVQWCNPSILRLYRGTGYLGVSDIPPVIELITRYALLATAGPLILPASYAVELEWFDQWAGTLSALAAVDALEFISPTRDLEAYVANKRVEYPQRAGELGLRAASAVAEATWRPRASRSTIDDIHRSWDVEVSDPLRLSSVFDVLAREIGAAPTLDLPSLLAGRAAVAEHFVQSLPVLQSESQARFDLEMFLSQEYLKSYLRETRAALVVDTPLGMLDCLLANDAVFMREANFKSLRRLRFLVHLAGAQGLLDSPIEQIAAIRLSPFAIVLRRGAEMPLAAEPSATSIEELRDLYSELPVMKENT